MHIYYGQDGTVASQELRYLVELATKLNQTATMFLNGYTVIAHPGDDVDQLVWAYELVRAWPFMELGKGSDLRAPSVQRLQRMADQAMAVLRSFRSQHFNDHKALVLWFLELQVPSLCKKVSINYGSITQIFAQHGFMANPLPAGQAVFSQEGWGRQLVNTALDQLARTKSIRPLFRPDALRWLQGNP